MTGLFECPGSEFYRVGRDLAEAGIGIRVGVRGQSMWPFLRTGDVVEVLPLPLDQVIVGDIVFFWSGEQLLAHRVVERIADGPGVCLITRGDAMSQQDRPLRKQSDLIGRVETVYRGRRIIRLDRGMSRLLGSAWARQGAMWRVSRLPVRALRGIASLRGRSSKWFKGSPKIQGSLPGSKGEEL